MTSIRRSPTIRWRPLMLTALAFTLSLSAALPSAADDRRTDRQIRLFERALDQMLVDSPNFLVQSRSPTIGTYDEGRGVTFTFKTSLVGARHWNDNHWWQFWDHDDDDDGVIVISRDDLEDMDDEDWDDLRSSRGKHSARELARQEKKWTRAKQEILDTVLDFGDALSALSDTETLTIDARLRRAAYFEEEDLRKFRMRVSMADIRAYGDGRITESEFKSRVTMTES